jgi:uncharacterized protein YgbK (DUF1537 family)
VLTVLADDLTGAVDVLGECAAVGRSGWVRLDHAPAPPGAPVVAIDLDGRDRDESAATERVREAVRATPGLLYVKIDSTLRGHVRASVEAALATRREQHPRAHAVVCPAFPAQGRTVEDGRVVVHGRPLPGPSLRELLDGLDVEVADARRDEDLADVAARADDPDTVWIGSAGLAAQLAVRRCPPSPPPQRRACGTVAVIVGTDHAVTRAQVAHLRAHDGDARILVGDAADPEFGSAAQRLVDRSDGLVLTGGATARAVLATAGVDLLHVGGHVAPGIPWAVATRAGLVVVTKSGGFGEDDTLSAAVGFLRS